ncbi:talin-like isoform X2 [Nematostella vectensis]|uniref:talin-like isoform X2 n=1 Tax=Nematostella vectensis TaxID=45351 RepID=UPI0020777A9F|nr:talin-like isoform X2 [Nematostella vectensis]
MGASLAGKSENHSSARFFRPSLTDARCFNRELSFTIMAGKSAYIPDMLEYKSKIRLIKIKFMDGNVKTLQIDDSHTVGQILETVCVKMGISNPEEFSLLVEGKDDEKEEAEKTSTLKRDKSVMKDVPIKRLEERDRKKMDQLKKKLHTEDDVQWLDHDKTLREQGTDDSHTVVMRRKYFYSDQNVDIKDPVQLNLLYVQCRDGILDGTHPCTQEEASQLGAIQIQVQFGDYEESKYKLIDLKEVLPKEYVKSKNIDKKIKEEHRKFNGLDELQGRYKYVQLCRGLKTYGVTFFLVKEKMKGKNKLVPRLLGITKESILRVDEKTKEVMKTWPLTTVRRWAASPNSFTLDFGDYTESYYSVQTNEGEKISQLIAGYIDIILKKRKGMEGYDPDFDEVSAMEEDQVAPSKGTYLDRQTNKVGHASVGSVALPAVVRAGGQGSSRYSMGKMEPAQYGTVSGSAHSAHRPPMGSQAKLHNLTPAQQAYMSSLSQGIDSVDTADEELKRPVNIVALGSDPASLKWKQNTLDVSRQNVASRLAALSASCASIVNVTSGEPGDTNYTAAGAAVHVISANLQDLSKGIKLIAGLLDNQDDSSKLLDAARGLAGAFSLLLKAAQEGAGGDKEKRSQLLNAAGNVGSSGAQLLEYMGEPEVDQETQETLLKLAQAVANATATLVLKAKNVASQCPDTAQQNKVIGAAKDTAMTTSQLVACVKLVVPSITSQMCQEQVVESAKQVAKAVEDTEGACKGACDPDSENMNVLIDAAQGVRDALNALLKKVREGGERPTEGEKYGETCDDILGATDRLFNSMGNAGEMVKQAKILAQATSSLVSGIKSEAEVQDDDDNQKRLLAAAKLLADATAKLVEAAKGAARNPNDADEQEKLKRAAEDLRSATNTAASDALKKKLVKRLENAAKEATGQTTQLVAAAQAAAPVNRNQASQQQLMDQLKPVEDQIARLLESLRDCSNNPDDANSQLNLINVSKMFIPPVAKLVAFSKAALPTIDEPMYASQLGNFSKSTAASLNELRNAAEKAAEACGTLEVDSALKRLKALDDDLKAVERAAEEGELVPLPGENPESSALELGATSKTVGSSMAQLLTAAAQGNESYTGIAARDTANALKNLTQAVRGVAAGTSDKDAQKNIVQAARGVIQESAKLINEAKKALNNPGDPNNQQRLAQVAKGVSQALNNCVNCLPGQREVEDSIKAVSAASQALSKEEFPPTTEPYQRNQEKLSQSGAALNAAASDVVSASRGSPNQLATSTKNFSLSYQGLVNSGLMLAGQAPDEAAKDALVRNLRNTSTASSKLLLAARSLVSDPNAPNAKNALANAARAVTDSINTLLNACMSAAPGQKECDSALRNIQAVNTILDNPVEPVNDSTYFDCLETVAGKSKDLTEAMPVIADSIKQADYNKFDRSIKRASNAVCALTETAAQAAYLVAVADPSSVAGKPGLIDQEQFINAKQEINDACQSLLNPDSSQQRVLAAATAVAKHTSALCNACKVASAKTHEPAAKRQFVQAAKDVANNTANLVKQIKTFAGNMNDDNRKSCASATRPLRNSVESLTAYALSPDFAPVPAKISDEARSAQVPVIMAGKSIANSGANYFNAAKLSVVNPQDTNAWQNLQQTAKQVADAMRRLITAIKDNAPGQRECDLAIEDINTVINNLDQASLANISDGLEPRTEQPLQVYQERMMQNLGEMNPVVEPLGVAAKSQPENIGHLVAKMTDFLVPLCDAAIGAASLMKNSKRKGDLLDQTKTVAESAAQMMYATKTAGGNPQVHHAHPAVDEAAQSMHDAIYDLKNTIEQDASESGIVSGLVDSISKTLSELGQSPYDSVDAYRRGAYEPFVVYQERMTKAMKDLVRKAQDMVGKSSTDPTKLGPLAKDISNLYDDIAHNARGAVATVGNADVAGRIRNGVQGLGESCIGLVQSAGAVQATPTDPYSKKDLADRSRQVAEKVSHLLAALITGSRGTQACINAASTVQGIVSDLDTTVMFATAGTLNPETPGETFADHREDILRTAKVLVEDTKRLVASAQASQDVLATAAESSVGSVSKLTDHVKLGAAAMGSDDSDAQQMLLNAARDVASALGSLINSTKNASGKSPNDPAMEPLKSSAKTMVSNVSSLLMTVKTVEDKTMRGTRAMESSNEAIKQAIMVLNSPTLPARDASPEDLIRSTKGVTLATAKAVAAGNSCNQDDVIAAANMGRKAVTEMLSICKAAAVKADTDEVKYATIVAGRDTAAAYGEVSELVINILQKPTPEKKARLMPLSKKVAEGVGKLVRTAETLKGSEWVNPEDPNIIAENELLGAAASIEAAARKLAELRPKPRPKEADDSLNFEEQILEAAKAITAATVALVKSASAAQRELIATGKIFSAGTDAREDNQWSQGLVSAARTVAAATQTLCEAANAAVQGNASEERLVAGANQVASSTAQLLLACRVKADAHSATQRRLQVAGNAVKRAAENLVRAAKSAAVFEEEETTIIINTRFVGGIAQELEAQEHVLKIEKELEAARVKLSKIRQAKYRPEDEEDL